MMSTLRLSTLTYIGRDEEKKLGQILTSLMELSDAAEFINPVDWEQLELNDYPLLVKNPMNLLKVEEKLKAREYRTVEEALDHIQLVWDNCKTYNPEGQYYILADKMERNFKKMIRNYLPNIPVIVPKPIGSQATTIYEKPAPPPPPPIQTKPQTKPSRNVQVAQQPKQIEQSIRSRGESGQPEQIPQSQKNRFHQRLKQLTQQQLGDIIFMIQQSCSQGYKDLGGGRGQIHLDNVDAENFRKLNLKLDEMFEADKHTGSKKVKV